MKNKVNPKEYKCTDYFNFEKYSYCDIEVPDFVSSVIFSSNCLVL